MAEFHFGGICVSNKRPWYKRFPADFIAGTAMLTDSEKGVYSTIIDMLNDRGGPIEDSPSDLARICGCASVKRFQSIKGRLVKLGKLAVVGDYITNARFERDGTARIDSVNRDVHGDLPEKPPPDLLEINGLASPQCQKPEAIKKTTHSRASARGIVPEDFELRPEDTRYAEDRGFGGHKIEQMLEAFRDHHRARGNLLADLFAAWRMWVRNEVKFNGGSNGAPSNGGGAAGVVNGHNGTGGAARTRGQTRDDVILAGMGNLARGMARHRHD